MWGVDDLWSVSLGANFNKHLGAEMTVDVFERDYDYPGLGTVGEVSAWNFVPQFRMRYPVLKDRLVPYTLLGIGPTFLQFNDAKPGTSVDIEAMTFAVAAGGGLEFFISDNVALGVEAKYVWINPINGKVEGQTVRVDVSSALFTFGLRVYFDENQPRPLVAGEPSLNRYYFGLRLGGFVMTDDRWSPGVKLTPEAGAKGSVNITGGLALGADFGEHWGVELTADSLETGFALRDVGTVGEYGMGAVIPHLRLRYPLDRGRWVPYFMTGVGAVYGETNDGNQGGDAGLRLHAQGIYPAFGIGAGVEYFLVRNLSLGADVRWLYTWGHEFRVGERRGKGDFSAAQFSLGLRVYLF